MSGQPSKAPQGNKAVYVSDRMKPSINKLNANIAYPTSHSGKSTLPMKK